MVKFIDVVKAEICKTKHTWNFTIALLLPITITAIIFIYYLNVTMKDEHGDGINHWINYSKIFFQFYYLIYPLFAALIAFSISNIESKNLGYKQLFTLPTRKFYIYFSKVVILLFWLFTSLVLAYSLLMLSGNLLSFLVPQLGFENYNMNHTILTFFARTFITLTTIISIHFFLSIFWNNFYISVGSAFFLVVVGIMINSWEYSYMIPYCNASKTFINFFRNSTTILNIEMYWSITYSIIFFIGGYLLITKKNIK